LLIYKGVLCRTAGGAVKRYSGPSGGGSVNQGGIWRYYTDDAAGLKMSDHLNILKLHTVIALR
jgi:hypothetical protein